MSNICFEWDLLYAFLTHLDLFTIGHPDLHSWCFLHSGIFLILIGSFFDENKRLSPREQAVAERELACEKWEKALRDRNNELNDIATALKNKESELRVKEDLAESKLIREKTETEKSYSKSRDEIQSLINKNQLVLSEIKNRDSIFAVKTASVKEYLNFKLKEITKLYNEVKNQAEQARISLEPKILKFVKQDVSRIDYEADAIWNDVKRQLQASMILEHAEREKIKLPPEKKRELQKIVKNGKKQGHPFDNLIKKILGLS